MKQAVNIKGQRDGIGIYIDESTDFWLVQVELRRIVSQSKDFFEGASSAVFFHGRDLSKQEELALIHIITSETNMDAILAQPGELRLLSPAEKSRSINSTENKTASQDAEPFQSNLLKTPNVPIPDENDSQPINTTRTDKEGRAFYESPTAYYQMNLRSGQSINYPGSVVVMGDINPGSEVIAGGNVTILGSLKGVAHAGANGDDTCTVVALVFEPTQIRIGKAISYVKPKEKGKSKQTPSCAYARDGVVYIGAF